METLAPVRLQRLASFLPWALVSMILLYGGQVGSGTVDHVIGYGGAAILALVSYRAAKMRMILGEDVIVIGWAGKTRHKWSEIEKFVVNPKGLAIRLRGGLEEQVPAFSMGGWLLKSMRDSMRADLERVCAKAEQHRRERRGKKK